MSECCSDRNNSKHSLNSQLNCLCVGKFALVRLDKLRWANQFGCDRKIYLTWRQIYVSNDVKLSWYIENWIQKQKTVESDLTKKVWW